MRDVVRCAMVAFTVGSAWRLLTLLSPALFKKASQHTCVPVWEHKNKKKKNSKNRGKDKTCDVQEHARSNQIVVQPPSYEFIQCAWFSFKLHFGLHDVNVHCML